MECTTAGTLIREISLQTNMKTPNHAIQLDNDQFLVCQTHRYFRVCLTDNNGQLIKSYGKYSGLGPGQLTFPNHLAADFNGFCLVIDFISNRLLMLNNKLKFVKELVPTSFGLKFPKRLCLDAKHKRLYVADSGNARIVAFDIHL